MRVLLAAAGEDGAVAPTLAKGGQEETPAHPASVERLACHLLFFFIFEQIAETGENSLPAASEFPPRDLLSAFGSMSLVFAPGIRVIRTAPGLRGRIQPTSQRGIFGLDPTPGASCRLSWSARANAKERNVDGEEGIVLADFHD